MKKLESLPEVTQLVSGITSALIYISGGPGVGGGGNIPGHTALLPQSTLGSTTSASSVFGKGNWLLVFAYRKVLVQAQDKSLSLSS